MNTGTVQRFNPKTGYGFITSKSGENVFVHQNDIEMDGFRYLKVGESVEFEEEESDRGLKAINVKVLSPRSDSDRPRRSRQPYIKEHLDPKAVAKDVSWMKGALNRLLDALCSEGPEGDDPLMSVEEVEEIRHGRR